MSNGNQVEINYSETKICKLSEKSRFIFLASDGVWEFLSSKKVAEIIEKYYRQGDIEGACDYLLNLSLKKWCQQDDNIDDITLILIFLDR